MGKEKRFVLSAGIMRAFRSAWNAQLRIRSTAAGFHARTYPAIFLDRFALLAGRLPIRVLFPFPMDSNGISLNKTAFSRSFQVLNNVNSAMFIVHMCHLWCTCTCDFQCRDLQCSRSSFFATVILKTETLC